MIYCNLSGGLGNQMFQYAFARSLQEINFDKLTINTAYFSNQGHNTLTLDQFRLNDTVQTGEYGHYGPIQPFQLAATYIFKKTGDMLRKKKSAAYRNKFERHFEKVLNLFNVYFESCGPVPYRQKFSPLFRNRLIHGYWQSAEYFDSIRNILIDEFTPKQSVTAQNANLLENIQKSQSVCVHFRRGDYVGHALHQICSIDYYLQAIEQLKLKIPEAKLFIFSDDIEWVKQHVDLPAGTIYSDQPNSSIEELSLMYNCKHFIISNSSFSWWAQYLSQSSDKLVYAPSRWYNTDMPTGVYMKSWQLINV